MITARLSDLTSKVELSYGMLFPRLNAENVVNVGL